VLCFLIINGNKLATGELNANLKRVHKVVLNAAALGAFVSGSMAASAPTGHEYPAIADAKILTQPTPRAITAKVPKAYAVGVASWYGKYFDGKPTASGEPYDMYELTAAHRTLPLGSWVKVTNLRNHRWVLVRINDRGPVPLERMIDLSYSAARILRMSGQGIAKVRLDVMRPPQQTSDMAMLTPPR
jgi:rare lipoprotein A